MPGYLDTVVSCRWGKAHPGLRSSDEIDHIFLPSPNFGNIYDLKKLSRVIVFQWSHPHKARHKTTDFILQPQMFYCRSLFNQQLRKEHRNPLLELFSPNAVILLQVFFHLSFSYLEQNSEQNFIQFLSILNVRFFTTILNEFHKEILKALIIIQKIQQEESFTHFINHQDFTLCTDLIGNSKSVQIKPNGIYF